MRWKTPQRKLRGEAGQESGLLRHREGRESPAAGGKAKAQAGVALAHPGNDSPSRPGANRSGIIRQVMGHPLMALELVIPACQSLYHQLCLCTCPVPPAITLRVCGVCGDASRWEAPCRDRPIVLGQQPTPVLDWCQLFFSRHKLRGALSIYWLFILEGASPRAVVSHGPFLSISAIGHAPGL